MNRKPKKSEAITVTNFNVTTRWVSVKINVSHITAKNCARPEIGLLRVASQAVVYLADAVARHAKYHPGSASHEIIRALRARPHRPFRLMFREHSPGQKLAAVELRMEARDWDLVKASAASLGVDVVAFCQDALHQRSVEIAEFYRGRVGKPEGRVA